MVILGDLLLTLAMGQGESTLLSLMTDHFSDVRARVYDLSLLVTKSKLILLCRVAHLPNWMASRGNFSTFYYSGGERESYGS